MFPLRATVILIIVLFGCFVLRSVGLEPFPAVMMPSGAYVLRKSHDQIKVSRTEVYAQDSISGTWAKIDLENFLDPVPIPLPELLPYLTNNNFGEDNNKLSRAKRVKYKTLKALHLLKDKRINPEKLDEMHAWVKNKFITHNMHVIQVKVVTIENTISTKTGSITATKILDENLVKL